MRADPLRAPWASPLLCMALLTTGCASLPLPSHPGTSLYDAPHEALASALAQGTGVETPRHLLAPHEAELPGLEFQRQTSRVRGANHPLTVQLAFRGAILEMSGTLRRMSGELARLKTSHRGLAGTNGVFLRHADYGTEQSRWIDARLVTALRLANIASEVEDPDMQLALLRMAGPRLEAAMAGSLLLAVWLDFLHLTDAALQQRLYSVETLFADMWRWQERLEPTMTALASQRHEQVEAAAQDVPSLVGHLTREFSATVEAMRTGAENLQRILVFTEAVEAATMLSTMRLSLPSIAPSAPGLVGMGLVVGATG